MSVKTAAPKTKSISWYTKQLDRHFSLLVREKGFCDASEVSTCSSGLQDAHIVGRANRTLRWDILNHLCLCYRHHIFFAHHDPVEFILWFQKKYPERWEYLLAARKIITKRNTDDYIELLKNVKERNIDKLHMPVDKLPLL